MRDRVCRRYLSQGFVVANVDYRPGIEESVEDAECALKWVSSNAERLEADPRRVVITGESAGAHLALLAAFQAPFPLAAVINFYGISDLMSLRDAEFVRRALRYERDDNAGVRLSPISYVHPGNPPTLSIHGTADATVPPEQTSTLTLRIRQSGGEAEEMWIAGGRHGFSESQLERAYDAVFDFLRRRRVIRS